VQNNLEGLGTFSIRCIHWSPWPGLWEVWFLLRNWKRMFAVHC